MILKNTTDNIINDLQNTQNVTDSTKKDIIDLITTTNISLSATINKQDLSKLIWHIWFNDEMCLYTVSKNNEIIINNRLYLTIQAQEAI